MRRNVCLSEHRSIILTGGVPGLHRTCAADPGPPWGGGATRDVVLLEHRLTYSLDPDQLAVQDLVRRVAREKVASRADEIDRTAEYPQDMFELLKELGLFALPFPAEYGGTGSLLSGCIAVEEFGRVCYNTGYLLVVQWVAFGALLAAGNDEQRARFLPGLASGALRGAFSTTEAHGGSD